MNLTRSKYIKSGVFFFFLTFSMFCFAQNAFAQSPNLISSNLTLGSTGQEVTLLQTWLSTDPELYPEQEVSGYYGPATKEAVKRYQIRSGIISTHPFGSDNAFGSVGLITRASLNAEFSNTKSKIAWVEGTYGEALLYQDGEFVRPTRKEYAMDDTHTILSAWVGPLFIDKKEALIFGNGKGYGIGVTYKGNIYAQTPQGKIITNKTYIRTGAWQHITLIFTDEDVAFIYNNKVAEVIGTKDYFDKKLSPLSFATKLFSPVFEPLTKQFYNGSLSKVSEKTVYSKNKIEEEVASHTPSSNFFSRIINFVKNIFVKTDNSDSEKIEEKKNITEHESMGDAEETQKNSEAANDQEKKETVNGSENTSSGASDTTAASESKTSTTTKSTEVTIATSTSTTTPKSISTTTPKTTSTTTPSSQSTTTTDTNTTPVVSSGGGGGGGTTEDTSIKPVINLRGDIVQFYNSSDEFSEPGVDIVDDKQTDAELKQSLVIDYVGEGDIYTGGNYELSYNVTDSDGNAADEVIRVIAVYTTDYIDPSVLGSDPTSVIPTDSNPKVTILGSPSVTLEQGTSVYTDPGALALDLEDGNISSNVAITGDDIDYNTPGEYVHYYGTTDSDGNTSNQATRTITVLPAPSGSDNPEDPVNYSLPPAGQEVVYSVSSSKTNDPRFVSVDINPLHVYVGNEQTLTVKVTSASGDVTSVQAFTQLDNGSLTLDLVEVGSDSSGTTFSTSWVVYDTHVTTYRTTFTATNSNGDTTSTTLAWSDPCAGITQGTDSTLSTDCTVSVTDGLDQGNLTIDPGTTLTLDSSAIWAFNPGTSITNNGTIILSGSASLKKGYLFYLGDTDATANTTTKYFFTTTPQTGYVDVGTYAQSSYYSQATYYSQVTYYTQVRYYSQLRYMSDVIP